MSLDFSKITAAVKNVEALVASHASLSALLADAQAAEAKAKAEVESLTASIEAALGNVVKPLEHAGAVGLTAVATALSDASNVVEKVADAISPTQPAAPSVAPVAPVAPVAVGVTPAPDGVAAMMAAVASRAR